MAEQDKDTSAIEQRIKAGLFVGAGDAEGAKRAYNRMRQNNLTNTMLTLVANAPNGLRNAKKDEVGNYTIDTNGIVFSFPGFLINGGTIKTATLKFMAFLHAECDGVNPDVLWTTKCYQERRGIKSASDAEREFVDGAVFLRENKITAKKKVDGLVITDIPVLGDFDFSGHYKRASFSSGYFNLVRRMSLMEYPIEAWQTNDRRNPNAFYLLNKFAAHRHMNAGKPNQNIISIRSLIQGGWTPYIPSFEKVQAGNRSYNGRIIEPFERDLNSLSGRLRWHYCVNLSGDAATEEHTEYASWRKLYIYFELKDYPEDSPIVIGKMERNKALAEAAKKRGTRKTKKRQKKEESGAQTSGEAK